MLLRNHLLLFLVLLLPLAAADPTPGSYCITANACVPGVPDAATCTDTGYQGTYYTPDMDYDDIEEFDNWDQVVTECQIIICHNTQFSICEDENRYFCNPPDEDVVSTCPAGSTSTCSEGQNGPCLCGDNELAANQYCCGGNPSTEACGGTTDPGDEGEGDAAVCNDGRWDFGLGEVCDPSVGDLSQCPAIVGQSCTMTCRCALLESDGNQGCSDVGGCDEQTCDPNTPISLTANIQPLVGTQGQEINLQWSPGNSCVQELTTTTVSLENTDDPTFNEYHTYPQEVFSDTYTGLQPGANYVIVITVNNAEANPPTSETLPLDYWVPETACATEASWCVDEDSYFSCIDESVRDCTSGFCYDGLDGGHECLSRVDCTNCNAGYGDFGEVIGEDIEVQVGTEVNGNGDQVPITASCQSLLGPANYEGSSEQIVMCYLDNQKSALRTYQACATVNSCSDYESANVCGDNPCSIQGECSYERVTNELFQCVSAETGVGECGDFEQGVCREVDYCFWIDGECLEATQSCQVLSGLGAEACIGTSQGGGNFALAQDYSVEQESINELEFTKCKYLPAENECIKDSDDNNAEEFDSDFRSPNTLLPFNEESTYGMPFTVVATVDEPPRYFHHRLYTSSCDEVTLNYQDLLDSEQAIIEEGDGTQRDFTIEFNNLEYGNYCIVYFAKDRGSNVEALKSKDLIVGDSGPEGLSITAFTTRVLVEEEGAEGQIFTDVEISFQLNRQETCSMTVGPPENATIPNPINDKFDDQFSSIQRGLSDGYYEVDITCDGAPFSTRSFSVDSDGRIFGPFPQPNAAMQPPIILGVNTISEAACEVEVGPDDWQDMQPTENLDGTYTHRISRNQVSNETGFYSMPVRCEFATRASQIPEVVDGGIADNIRYVVDRLPPNMIVEIGDSYTLDQLPYNIPRSEEPTPITINCIDQPISGENNNWEAGSPSLTVNSATNQQVPHQTTLSLGERIDIQCEDGLGNEGRTTYVQAPMPDDAGPSGPMFEVIE